MHGLLLFVSLESVHQRRELSPVGSTDDKERHHLPPAKSMTFTQLARAGGGGGGGGAHDSL